MTTQDDLELPPRGYTTDDVRTLPTPRPRRRRRLALIALAILVTAVLIFALYTWVTLNVSYAEGKEVGYVQEFSRRGWLCKTWEGTLTKVTGPSTPPELLRFSVRDDSIAREISGHLGKRVILTYEQHKGVPTDCFGRTETYVTGVRPQ